MVDILLIILLILTVVILTAYAISIISEVIIEISDLFCSFFEERKREKRIFKEHPKLRIPKKIAEALDDGDILILAWTHGNDLLGKVSDEERNIECRRREALSRVYLASKVLGVELVEVEE